MRRLPRASSRMPLIAPLPECAAHCLLDIPLGLLRLVSSCLGLIAGAFIHWRADPDNRGGFDFTGGRHIGLALGDYDPPARGGRAIAGDGSAGAD